ncbi:Dual specificity like protein [Argiope bruennichi]|uniref:Dual specificity like protein n=1 Tax=Argiope bruennichi TaxID=94029 RepID=A0A8T0FAM0_ARGBR|nr:Dual specificity like protein [Argiope bruennichi]
MLNLNYGSQGGDSRGHICRQSPVGPDTKEVDILREKAFLDQLGGSPNRGSEVILGAPYGMPIDMWAFGCIAGEMLTNRILYPGENNAEMLALFQKSHRNSEVDEDVVGPLNRIAFSVPGHKFTSKEMLQRINLSEVVKGCLALHPSSTYETNTALAADFFKADESSIDKLSMFASYSLAKGRTPFFSIKFEDPGTRALTPNIMDLLSLLNLWSISAKILFMTARIVL